MAILQELDNERTDHVLAEAVRRNVPALLTVRMADGWLSLHSRLLAIRGQHLCLDLPLPDDRGRSPEFPPARKVGVSFKLKHHKHIFTAVVVGVQTHRLDHAEDVQVLVVCMPTQMQRLQRRAYMRADVPANRVVRASFWQGGKSAEPIAGQSQSPVWYGHVRNLSAGGFQVHTDGDASAYLDVGDLVGVRLSFGAGARETTFCDATLRHLQQEDGQTLMGFQFIGLDQTDEGRSALQRISSKVVEFHRIAEQAPAAPAVVAAK